MLAFHVANRHYPDGDADRIRALENEITPWTVVEDRFPRFNPGNQPLMVDEKIAREIFINSWMENNKEIDARDPAVHVAACSVQSNSSRRSGTTLKLFKDLKRSKACENPYDACMMRVRQFSLSARGLGLTRVPACITRKGENARIMLLDMDRNKIKKIEGLDSMKELSSLSFSRNQLSKIDGLASLKDLTHLELVGNKIAKIEGLDNLTKLHTLNLSENKDVGKIENLDTLVKLRNLDMTRNNISKIEGLDTLAKLKRLILVGNHIENIENIDALTRLTILALDGSNVKKIENVDALARLQYLLLNENQIDKIENLERLTELEEVQLAGNRIKKLENLDTLVKLKKIDVRNNPGMPAGACITFNAERVRKGLPRVECKE